MNCKICNQSFQTILGHVQHYELSHRVSVKSQFTCGIEECFVKLGTLEGYEKHVNICHPAKTCNLELSESNTSPLSLKCAFPGCHFKSKSKGALRSHKFWSHSNEQAHVFTEPVDELRMECPPPTDITNVTRNEIIVQPVLDFSSEEESLQRKLTHMSLSLSSKYHVPDSTIAYVLQSYSCLLNESLSITRKKLSNEIDSSLNGQISIDRLGEIFSEDPLIKLHGPEGPLRSYYCRNNQYEKASSYIKPQQICLGLNSDNIPCKYHYVSIKDSIQLMFNDDTVYEQYLVNKERKPLQLSEDLIDIHSGSVYRENQLFSQDASAIEIVIFQDEIDLVKALGAAAGSFKLFHVAFTLGNLHPWNRSKVDPLQLLLLCKEKDVTYFGLPKVLEPLIKDLNDLEINGMEIRGQIVKASVLVMLGDNLGTHTVGGFLENFSKSHYFCRYCEESRSQWQARWKQHVKENSDSESDSEEDNSDEDESSKETEKTYDRQWNEENENDDSDDDVPLDELIPLSGLKKGLQSNVPYRTVQSYNRCLEELQRSPNGVKGVVANCEFNKLNYFHIVGGSPPCLPHDIFEGFAPYDIQLCLKKLASKYKFKLTK